MTKYAGQSVFIAYRRRWLLKTGANGTVCTDSKLEVPVAVLWTEDEVRDIAARTDRLGLELVWEEVALRSPIESAQPGPLYLQCQSVGIDKDDPAFWQLVAPIGIMAFTRRDDVDEAVSQSPVTARGYHEWSWDDVIEFTVPWDSPFLYEPLTQQDPSYMEQGIELTT